MQLDINPCTAIFSSQPPPALEDGVVLAATILEARSVDNPYARGGGRRGARSAFRTVAGSASPVPVRANGGGEEAGPAERAGGDGGRDRPAWCGVRVGARPVSRVQSANSPVAAAPCASFDPRPIAVAIARWLSKFFEAAKLLEELREKWALTTLGREIFASALLVYLGKW